MRAILPRCLLLARNETLHKTGNGNVLGNVMARHDRVLPQIATLRKTGNGDNLDNMNAADKKVLDKTAEILLDRLPPGWRVEPRLVSGPLEASLVFTSSEGRSRNVPVAVRRRIDPRTARQLPRLPLLMVVAPYLSKSVRAVLQDLGVSYADVTGNSRVILDEPGLFVVASGAQSNPQPDKRRLSLRGVKAGLVVRVLAASIPPLGVRELAQRAGADPGYVSRLLTQLDGEALVDRTSRGRVNQVDWRGLLARWATDAPLSSRAEESTWIAPRGLKSVFERLKSVPLRYLVTGSAATSHVAQVAPTRLLSVYVDDPVAAGELLGLRRADAGANVVLLEPRDDVIFEVAVDFDGLRQVPWTVVAADLMTGPGRSPAEAEALLDWMDDHEEEWRG